MSPARDISFLRSEAEAFLTDQHHVVLVASDGDDAPFAVPAHARFEAGVLVVSVPDTDPIVDALTADARACCIAEQFPDYFGIKSVIVHGTSRPSAPRRDGEATFIVPLERLTTFDFGRLRE